MPTSSPPFTLGIEEEYLLVDPVTRNLAVDPPDALFNDCKEALGSQVSHEFLRSQIEIGTTVCKTVPEARRELAGLRRTIIDIAAKYDLAPIAASTHPFSEWQKQVHTDDERYNVIAHDMQVVVRRLMICGMHVHAGTGDDDDLRIDLMNQAAYFLPHLLALSTSSPFWEGEDTGLMSYRLSVFNEMPRTGLPDRFDSHAEFDRHVQALVDANLIQDATKLWWDLRPSGRFPTLEVRICDACTTLDDTVAIAALYVCIMRMLWRLKTKNQRWRTYAPMLVNENRWRAQRYGLDEGLVDFGKGELTACADLVEELIELTAEDADALGCTENLAHLRTIVARGTSAHRQRALYTQGIDAKKSKQDSLNDVVDFLISETAVGTS